jgi:hypothetical protein
LKFLGAIGCTLFFEGTFTKLIILEKEGLLELGFFRGEGEEKNA